MDFEDQEDHKVTSRRLHKFIVDELLNDFFAPDAVKSRATEVAKSQELSVEETNDLIVTMLAQAKKNCDNGITERTCRSWMHELGFNFSKQQAKGVYHDGHEREDVVRNRQNFFLPKVKKFLRRTRLMREVVDVSDGTRSWQEVPPTLFDDEVEIIWVNQDESLFYATEGDSGMWVQKGKSYIKPKGKGPKLHLSGFIMYPAGEWVDIETIEPAKDGQWGLPALEKQTSRVLEQLTKRFDAEIGVGKYQIAFTFDHSTIHCKLPDDALRVTQMNLLPGGDKGKHMRPTQFNGKEQSLQFQEGDELLFTFSRRVPILDDQGHPVKEIKTKTVKRSDGTTREVQELVQVLQNKQFRAGTITKDGPLSDLIGWPKGQKQFLMERGQWIDGLKAKCGATHKNHTSTCCAKGVMYHQIDFQQTVSKLQEIIASAGHICLFLPRYHCELAPIERAWGFAKWYCRRYCEYNMNSLRRMVPKALAMVTPTKIRQYFNNCFRICSLYASGMSLTQWLEYDTARKKTTKKIGRFIGLVKQGKDRSEKLKHALLELEKFNSVQQSSHRTFSKNIDMIMSSFN